MAVTVNAAAAAAAAPESLDELSAAILRALATVPADASMSLPRLGKLLGVGVSVLMRRLTLMGDARLGGVDGPGWVRVTQHDERWTAQLTEAGRHLCAAQWPGNDPSS